MLVQEGASFCCLLLALGVGIGIGVLERKRCLHWNVFVEQHNDFGQG